MPTNSESKLKSLDITHILSIGVEPLKFEGFEYQHFPADDDENEKIRRHFEEAFEFI